MMIFEKYDIEQRLGKRLSTNSKQMTARLIRLCIYCSIMLSQLQQQRKFNASVNYFNQINANSAFANNQPAAAIQKTGID